MPLQSERTSWRNRSPQHPRVTPRTSIASAVDQRTLAPSGDDEGQTQERLLRLISKLSAGTNPVRTETLTIPEVSTNIYTVGGGIGLYGEKGASMNCAVSALLSIISGSIGYGQTAPAPDRLPGTADASPEILQIPPLAVHVSPPLDVPFGESSSLAGSLETGVQ